MTKREQILAEMRQGVTYPNDMTLQEISDYLIVKNAELYSRLAKENPVEKRSVLVVFQEIPETTKFVELQVEPGEAEWLASVNGYFVNGAETPDDVAEAISHYFYEDGCGIFKFPTLTLPLRSKGYDLIVETGFVL